MGFHPRARDLHRFAKEGRVFRQPDRPEDHHADSERYLALIGFLFLCFLVGISNGMLTVPNIVQWYALLPHPVGTPPNAVFGPVWTLLYVLMAVAAWRVWLRPGSRRALSLWGWQLVANAAWSPVFFALHRPGIALAVMAALNVLIAATIAAFRRIDRIATLLMAPYLAWALYAAYLNAGFWWLNR